MWKNIKKRVSDPKLLTGSVLYLLLNSMPQCIMGFAMLLSIWVKESIQLGSKNKSKTFRNGPHIWSPLKMPPTKGVYRVWEYNGSFETIQFKFASLLGLLCSFLKSNS